MRIGVRDRSNLRHGFPRSQRGGIRVRVRVRDRGIILKKILKIKRIDQTWGLSPLGLA